MNIQPRSMLRVTVDCVLLCAFAWIWAISFGYTNAFAQSPATDLTVIQSDNQAIVLELAVNSYTLEEQTINGVEYHLVQINGLDQVPAPHHPLVPSYGTMVGLPTTHGVTLEVVDATYTEQSGYHLPAAPEFTLVHAGMDDGITGDLVEHFVDDPIWGTDDRLLPTKIVDMKQPGYLRGQAVAQLQFYPVQYNPTRQILRIYQRIQVRITWPPTVQAAGQNNRSSDPAFQSVFASSLVNYPQIAAPADVRASALPGAAAASATTHETDPKTAIKRLARIEVSEDGFYEITYAALAHAKVAQADLSEIPIAQLAIENQGAPVRIGVADADQDGKFTQGDSIHFYGVKLRKNLPADQPPCLGYSEARPDDWYADDNVYWLTQSDAAARIPQIDSTILSTSTVAAPTYRLTRHFEEDERYWQAMPGQQCEDRWFWQRRLSATENITLGITSAHTYTLPVGVLPQTAATPSLIITATLHGYSGGEHPFTVAYTKADRTVVPLGRYGNGLREQVARSIAIPITYEQLGQMNNLLIEAEPITGQINQFLVNWFEVTVEEAYATKDANAFLFGKSTMAAELIELHGLDAGHVEIYDITNPAEPEQILNPERLSTGALRFQSRSGYAERITCQGNRYLGRCYLAITRQAYRTPAKISSYQAPDQLLAARSRNAEYVIITAEPFVLAATALADHRRTISGLDSTVVTVSQIYDEFNDGIPNPRAIRDFLEYAYHCWNGMRTPSPLAYVALMGDANQDYKNHLGVENNFVPSFNFESTLFGEVSSDNWFVSIATNIDDVIATSDVMTGDRVTRLTNWCDDPHSIIAKRDALPDLFVGRIPVADEASAEQYVAKIVDYEKIPFSTPWTRDIYFVADDEPKFETSVKELQASISGLYNMKIMAIPNSESDGAISGQSPDAKALEIVENFQQGKLLVSYIGHGDYDAWGRWDAGAPETPYIFHKAYLARMENRERLPLVVVGNCLNGFFAGPTPNTSFAEAFLLEPKNGAIAVWAPTGLGLPSGHRILLGNFYKILFLTNGFNSKYDSRIIGVAAQSAIIQTYVANNYWEELGWTYVMFGDPALKMPIVSGTYLPIIATN